MKLRRLTDRINLYIWTISLIVVSLVFIKTSIKIISLQACLVTLQLLLVFMGVKAFDKRHLFSVKVSKTICKSLDRNIVPTSKAVEDYKETLRREYAKRS